MLWHAMKLGVVTTKAFLEKNCKLGPCSIHIDGLELVYEALGGGKYVKEKLMSWRYNANLAGKWNAMSIL